MTKETAELIDEYVEACSALNRIEKTLRARVQQCFFDYQEIKKNYGLYVSFISGCTYDGFEVLPSRKFIEYRYDDGFEVCTECIEAAWVIADRVESIRMMEESLKNSIKMEN